MPHTRVPEDITEGWKQTKDVTEQSYSLLSIIKLFHINIETVHCTKGLLIVVQKPQGINKFSLCHIQFEVGRTD